ncbi:MAG: CYTH domain-containing protein [Candidatus Paceibacterota bacterium]
MPREIERKFLLKNFNKKLIKPMYPCPEVITQGYIISDEEIAVRIRSIKDCSYGVLCIKRAYNEFERSEIEITIPHLNQVKSLMNMCSHVLKKSRVKVKVGKHIWDIDTFMGDNKGLVLAEVELKRVNEKFKWPTWVRPEDEVTNSPFYLNCNLAKYPYKSGLLKIHPFDHEL